MYLPYLYPAMQRIPSAGTAISRAAAAEIPSRTHRPARALEALAALPMSMRPRTQTAIIIARLRSKTARILHSIKNLFRLRRLLHRRIPYNPPPKRWRAHSHKPRLLAPASSPTLRAKLLCRPAPDVHRATWQRRRTMQRPRQQKPRPVRRIVPQELRSLSWAARSRRIRSRNRPYIPSQNPIHAAARRCRITAVLLCPARQEKRQPQIHRATPISRPAAQENRITAATHRDRRYRPSLHNSAAPLCSRLIHNAEHPEWQLLQMQCRTILFCRLPHRAARHNPSAAQECQTIRTVARYEIRKQNPFSSAVPLCKLQTWQARSQQQIIRLRLLLRDPVWQEIRLCRTAAHRQFPHKTVWQENSQLPIWQKAPVPHRSAIPQELVRGRSNRAVRRIRQRPVRQERSARPSAGTIPSPCSRRRAFPRMGMPRSRSRTMFLPSSPAARCSRPAESVWMAAPQLGSILHPQRRYLRQRRLPTAKLVRLRARPRGLIRRVKRSSTLCSAQFPPQAAAQKSRYRRLAHKLPLVFLPNGRAENRQLWAA